jgi:transcriptional regulator with XRE-family HTH domain
MSSAPPPHDFAATLREALDRRGFSHARFAGVVDVSENTVSSWVTGRYRPGHKNLVRIAAALEMSLDELHEQRVPAPAVTTAIARSRDDVAREIVEQLAQLDVDARLEQLQRATPNLLRLLAEARRHVDERP